MLSKMTILLFILGGYASFAHAEATVSIIGVGDIMLGTNYPTSEYLPPNEGRELLKAVEPILSGADVTFGNLEGSIFDRGASLKSCQKCFAFRMPDFLASRLKDAGFDVLSIANNHVRDFGEPGLENTVKVLTNLGIAFAGLLTYPKATFTQNGVRYGFAAFAPNIGTVSINDIPNAQQIVRDLASVSDIVIVSFHGGAEGSAHQHVPATTERFYGENRGDVHQFAHAVIDAGADVVFGHGPHVTRAVEVYQKRFIAYSLGNFCTYGRFNLDSVTGVAPIIKVNVTRNGEFVDGEITSVKQIKWKGVYLDAQQTALKLIRKLTQDDGFMQNLQIDAQGLIKPLS